MERTDFATFRRRVLAGIEADLAREADQAAALRAAVLPRLTEGLAEARRLAQCGKAWLFGSFAWGQPTERSDIDILVADCPDPDALAAALWRDAERAVHVVAMEHAARSLVERVLSEGQPL